MAGFLSVNRTVTNLGGEFRHLRLPRMNPFPKLERRNLPTTTGTMTAARHLGNGGTVIIQAGGQVLPEMASDVVHATSGCAVGNVKRGPVASPRRRSWAQWLGWQR